jgi:hypothetical protein
MLSPNNSSIGYLGYWRNSILHFRPVVITIISEPSNGPRKESATASEEGVSVQNPKMSSGPAIGRDYLIKKDMQRSFL